jgi:hypothetical protein
LYDEEMENKMKKRTLFQERGQALVMIAIGAVVLFGFTALAIDGSRIFSDRRHSQNASDTAVLAAALAKIRGNSWETAGLSRAANNQYNDTDANTQVIVRSCDSSLNPSSKNVTEDGITLTCQGLPAGAVPAQFIQVHIKSVVDLYFARVLGFEEVTNHTDAISRATDPEIDKWFNGYAISSLHEGCQSAGDGDPFQLGGSATVTIQGAGVLVNANCPTQNSFVQSGVSSSLQALDGGTCVVGTADNTTGVNPPPKQGCEGIPADQYTLPPAPQCKKADGTLQYGTIKEDPSGVWTATPGYYNTTFPDVQGGSAYIKLGKGVYCLNHGISVNGGWTITTDLNGNGVHDAADEGAFLYIQNGNVTFNGGATVTLHAVSSSSIFDPAWINLLMFVDPANEADIEISGNSGSGYTGTILATTSHVHLLGNGGTVGLNSQIISDTVKISGSTTFELTYNEADNAPAITNPGIELIK